MPKVLRMPPESALRQGAHREFVGELFEYYREAGRPTLRKIAEWIADNDALDGTASPETVRRVLVGKVQPTWPTAQAILYALCALAGRNVNEERWHDTNNFNDDGPIVTLEGNLQAMWNRMIDEVPSSAPVAPDPWAVRGVPMEEPPF